MIIVEGKSWEQTKDVFPSSRFLYKGRSKRLLFLQLRSLVKV
jgi:hypothetical protein